MAGNREQGTGNSKSAKGILSVSDLRVHFDTRHGLLKAVDGISFELKRGEVLGIVGESGSGKSVSCLALMGLLPVPPARIAGGTAIFSGADLLKLDPESLRAIRGDRISMVFQEPMTSLNPYMKIGDQLVEILTTHRRAKGREAEAAATEMLDRVGIPDASMRFNQYPHEFSGGMRQRVMIAMALLSKPDILIADEPTTALDVTIQAQILELIRELKSELGMAVILISHAMGVVAEISNQIIVMYAGRAVERGTPDEIFRRTAHPYTRALIDSMPSARAESHRKRLSAISGLPPDLVHLPHGCAFAPRCPYVQKICAEVDPEARARPGTPSHQFRCHVDI